MKEKLFYKSKFVAIPFELNLITVSDSLNNELNIVDLKQGKSRYINGP